MKDSKKERSGVVPTAVPRTPALVKRGAAAVIAVGLVGCGPSQPADQPPQQPPQVVPPQAPPQPEEMTPPQEPPQVAPPPQAPPPQAPQR